MRRPTAARSHSARLSNVSHVRADARFFTPESR